MPKRLSDITHAYERSAADLEQAQDELTVAMEHYRSKVEAASHAYQAVADELLDYLRKHPAEVVVANDFAYFFGPKGNICRGQVYWAHHVWVEDAEPAPTYRVPAAEAVTEWAPYQPNFQPGSEPDGKADMVARANALSAAWALGSEDPAEETAS